MNATVQPLPDENGRRIILCSGEFDTDTIPALRAELHAAKTHQATRVIIDVSQITFADSTFLSTLITGHRTLSLILAGPIPPHLKKILAITRLDSILTITPTLQTAADHP